MTYHLLNPAPIGEIIENNNKNKNKSKTKKKCTSYKDILNPKVEQQYSTIDGFDEDDEENIDNFNNKSLEMQYTNNNLKSENININNNKETFNNIYDSNQDNHYKSNYGNYDNNYTIDNSEFNKYINYSQGSQHMQENINTPNINNNKELLSKINYVIHLLEEQRSEKTNYITEELILYLFLGVFIIFVLDTFFKSSKYTR